MAKAGTTVGRGSGSPAGTVVTPGSQGAVFQDLLIQSQLVTDAWADPSDTPVSDTLRVQRDAGGKIALFHYSAAGWVAVAMS